MNGSTEKYFFKPKPVEEIINTAKVVFDTNALLSAYQWKDVVFHEVLEALSKLSYANRLKIPPQVFKEFIHQRPLRITEAIEKIESLLASIQKPQRLESVLPLLGLIDKGNTYVDSEKSYADSRDKYKEDLKQLIIDLKALFNDDIVLDSLKPFFENIDFGTNSNEKELLKCAEDRAKAKRPPLTGGDGGKVENKYGDFFVWSYILSLKDDVIFVTTDSKEDWFHKSGAGKEKKPVSPRRELIEEFYEASQGRTVCIISLQDFMLKFKPGLDKEIVESFPVLQNTLRFNRYILICVVLTDTTPDRVIEFVKRIKSIDTLYCEILMSERAGTESTLDRLSTGTNFEILLDLYEPISSDLLKITINSNNSLFRVLIAYEEGNLL